MIDSHAHLAFESFNDDRDAVVKRLLGAGVNGWIEVGTSVSDSQQAIALAEKYPQAFATVGVHPSGIGELTEAAWQALEEMMGHERVRAIGEVGFDFYRGGSLPEQTETLKRFIAIANQHGLPVVFHVRDGKEINAHDQLVKLLRKYSEAERPRGVIHTYSGTAKQAQAYLELGMHLSFSGVITFKNAGEILAAAQSAPAGRILIETDCPFLAPDPYRGKRNEPAYVAIVANKLADIRGVTLNSIAAQTQNNAAELFNCSW